MKELQDSKRKCIDVDEEDTASNTMQHFSKKMKYDKEQKRKAKHGGGGGPSGGGHKGKFKKKKAH